MKPKILIPSFPCDLDMDRRLNYVGYNGPEVLNLGSGVNPIDGAVNVDVVTEGRGIVDLSFDLQKPWPLPDMSFDKVLAFHVLEHLLVTRAIHFFSEAHRVLKPGGLLIIEVPDVVGMAKELLAGNLGIIRQMYGKPDQPGQAHTWGWEAASLWTMASAVGFNQGVTKPGTDYHRDQLPTVRLEAVK